MLLEETLSQLKLNADKTKCMLLTNAKSRPQNIPSAVTLEGKVVNFYNYLILIDDSLTFKPLVQLLA